MTTLPAMMDLGMEVLKVLAVIGGASAGGLASGGLLRLSSRVVFRRKVPRPAAVVVQVLGGAVLGLLVWLWVYGSGGWGPGQGGLWGLGSGGAGKGAGGDAVSTAKESKQGGKKADEKTTDAAPPAGADTLRVEMLGGQRVKEERFYLLDGGKEPRTLSELRQVVAGRKGQKDKAPLRKLDIVVYENSVASDHPAVRDLEKWAKENDLEVTLTFPKREMP